MEALARSTCSHDDDHESDLWEILKDHYLDSDLRISAFRALLPCYSEDKPHKFFHAIRRLLREEKMNQGKFI